MSNRFGHLKNRNKDVQAFIEEAEKSTSVKESEEKNILLSASSRMSRDEAYKKPVLLHIKKDIAEDIQKYCHGNKQAILNYLLRRGLDSLIKENKLILM